MVIVFWTLAFSRLNSHWKTNIDRRRWNVQVTREQMTNKPAKFNKHHRIHRNFPLRTLTIESIETGTGIHAQFKRKLPQHPLVWLLWMHSPRPYSISHALELSLINKLPFCLLFFESKPCWHTTVYDVLESKSNKHPLTRCFELFKFGKLTLKNNNARKQQEKTRRKKPAGKTGFYMRNLIIAYNLWHFRSIFVAER